MTVIEDPRRIVALFVHQGGNYYTKAPSPYVCANCDRILPYEESESNESRPVLWFAVYMGGKIWRRVSGRNVTVEYAVVSDEAT